MPHRKENSNDLSRFLRYSGKRMKGKERNAFEKKLQKDSFDSEAAEGLSLATPGEVERDLREISQRLRKHSRRKIPVIFLRIAAVVTLLLATSVTIMIVRSDHKQPLVSENIKLDSKENVINIPAAPSVTKAVSESTDQKEGSTGLQVNKIAGVRSVSPVGTDTVTEYEAANEVILPGMKAVVLEDQKLSNFSLMEAMETREKDKTKKMGTIRGTVISNEDNQPLPGVAIVIKGTDTGVVSDVNGKFAINVNTEKELMLVANFIGMKSQEFSAKPDSSLLIAMNSDMMALDEVVVVAYGASKKENATGSSVTINYDKEQNTYDYIAPEPVAGYTGFKRYIEYNLHYPEDFPEKNREVVVISMIIRLNGLPDSIKIVKSPGKAFSDEAIRLIKEGPAWKPAMVNNVTREEEVKVRIVFDGTRK